MAMIGRIRYAYMTLTGILLSMFALYSLASASDQEMATSGAEAVDKAAKTAITVFSVLGALVFLLIAVFIAIKLMKEFNVGPWQVRSEAEQALRDAVKYEKKGEFNLAAVSYEKAGDKAKAAILYERGKSFVQAGRLYEESKKLERALDMYKKGKDEVRMAEVHMKLGNLMEAAKLFKGQGDPLRAAQALEKLGNRAAAAREYGLSGQYLKSSKLFSEEKMYAQAAHMFIKSLGGATINQMNLHKFYTYAALLVMSGQEERAMGVYQEILEVDDKFRDVTGKLLMLEKKTGIPSGIVLNNVATEEAAAEEAAAETPATMAEVPATPATPAIPEETPAALETTAETATGAATAEEIQQKEMQQTEIDDLFEMMATEAAQTQKQHGSTLRGMIASGTLNTRYSIRLWMLMLKMLDEHHGAGRYFGCIAPEDIEINQENNGIRIKKTDACPAIYTAPEIIEDEAEADAVTDIYPMGVMLYEMITGSTEHIGKKYPIELVPELPEWLDALIVRCMEKDRLARYPSLNEVASIIMTKAYDL